MFCLLRDDVIATNCEILAGRAFGGFKVDQMQA